MSVDAPRCFTANEQSERPPAEAAACGCCRRAAGAVQSAPDIGVRFSRCLNVNIADIVLVQGRQSRRQRQGVDASRVGVHERSRQT